jgi:hypothetical protein
MGVHMTRCLIGGLAALAMGLTGLSVAPAVAAGPYCDFFDIAGLCDVRDAVSVCWDAPEVCEQYSQDPSQYQ